MSNRLVCIKCGRHWDIADYDRRPSPVICLECHYRLYCNDHDEVAAK